MKGSLSVISLSYKAYLMARLNYKSSVTFIDFINSGIFITGNFIIISHFISVAISDAFMYDMSYLSYGSRNLFIFINTYSVIYVT